MEGAFAAEVGDAIGSISSQLRLRFAAAGSGIGFVALATLRHLVRWGPRAVSELAASDQVTTQAISIRVSPLVEAGLVARRVDPADGRRTLLEVTSAGRNVVEAASRQANAALRSALDSVAAADRRAVENALPALRSVAMALREQISTASGGGSQGGSHA
jgi:DNA-binding MarR family transcriptional regulator